MDFPVLHYRPTSSSGGRLRGWFREGQLAASFGSHPFFEFLKCARRCTIYPFLIGALTRLTGYFWWKCSHDPVLPPEKVAFLRRQQMAKISRQVWKFTHFRPGRIEKPAG
jgi:biofilm PGA synthesis N-glycosyltransferase PgaC